MPSRRFHADAQQGRIRFKLILAALLVYLAFALLLKPEFAERVSDSLSDVRETVMERFPKHPAHPVNLNTAGVDELEQLPGVGPVTAREIIRFRERSGPIRQPEDLLALPRFTRRSLERIRPYVFIAGGPPQ